MQNINNKNEEENLKASEKKGEPNQEWSDFGKEKREKAEKKETSPTKATEEKNITEGLMREINLIDAAIGKKVADEKVQKTDFFGQKEKIETLLKIARERGVEAAIQVAKEMNDSYLLDTLHDILAKEGYYQNFKK